MIDRAEPRKRTLLFTLALRAVNATGQIAISVYLLKIHGPAAVGYFAVFISNTMLAALLSRQGFDRTLTLFAVRSRASTHALPLFRYCAKSILAWTPLTGALNILVFYATIGEPPSTLMMAILLLLPTVIAISSLASGYLTGFGNIVGASVQQPGFAVALTAFVAATTYTLGSELDVFVAYFLVASGIAAIGTLRVLSGSPHGQARRIDSGALLSTGIRQLALRYSRRYLVINFFTTFSSVYFVSFLALFVAGEDIGQFKIVERLAMVIAFNLTFLNLVLPARAISRWLANDRTQFEKSMKLTFQFQYATGFGVFLAYLLFMTPLMGWFEIQNTVLYLLLLAAQLVNALTGPVRVILMYLNGQRVLQVSAVVETIGSALLYWFLYGAYGLTGLAVGYFLAITVPNVVLAWIVYRRFGVIPIPFVPMIADSRR